jgi:hypothetical protein
MSIYELSTEVRADHKACLIAVYQNDYYIHLLEKCLQRYPNINKGDVSLNDICSFWNTFWAGLPDSRSIHREPFNQICDLAEGSYLKEYNDDENI